MKRDSVVVVGAGIVGLATARALLQAGRSVLVLEKEARIAAHQSTHNSGVLHCGLHYAPGSARARLARTGIRLMVEYCRTHGIAHDVCGKLVVALDEPEVQRLRALHERGRQNGLQGLRWLAPEEARELEPHVYCRAALHVPEEGIADYRGVCARLAADIAELGGSIRTRAEVRSITKQGTGWHIETPGGAVRAGFLVNCAGLYVDRVARRAGADPETRIVPFRGEYFTLRPERQHLVRNLIYPVPDPAFPFLGVHFTRRARGGIEAGPNAVLALAREGYGKLDINLRDLAEAVSYRGLRRFVARYPHTVWSELRRSFSRAHFLRALQRLVPELQDSDLAPGGSGVRAQAVTPAGDIVHDFLWLERPGAVHVLSAPSPAATAALAIGAEIAARVG